MNQETKEWIMIVGGILLCIATIFNSMSINRVEKELKEITKDIQYGK